ncbi:hypothetical protein E2C01_047250 [Portunus trituberculatus]|uniref:Uncharacterized protein n=1 Tax=Portunus trituberculatus TaxID=210409 RepID=A0A5B7G354_PORTR|nr:hypothetical protein [Portunus trituberculatus]
MNQAYVITKKPAIRKISKEKIKHKRVYKQEYDTTSTFASLCRIGVLLLYGKGRKETSDLRASPSAADLPLPRPAVRVTVVRSVFSVMATTNCSTAFAWCTN